MPVEGRPHHQLVVTFVDTATGDAASLDLSDTPTLDELGLNDFEVVTGSGLTVPAGTPPATVKVLGDALQKVLDDPEVQARLRGLGTEGRKMTPEQYDALLKKEDAAAAQMIKDGLLKAE